MANGDSRMGSEHEFQSSKHDRTDGERTEPVRSSSQRRSTEDRTPRDCGGPCFACFEDALAAPFGDSSWTGGESAALDPAGGFEAGSARRLQPGGILAQT